MDWRIVHKNTLPSLTLSRLFNAHIVMPTSTALKYNTFYVLVLLDICLFQQTENILSLSLTITHYMLGSLVICSKSNGIFTNSLISSLVKAFPLVVLKTIIFLNQLLLPTLLIFLSYYLHGSIVNPNTFRTISKNIKNMPPPTSCQVHHFQPSKPSAHFLSLVFSAFSYTPVLSATLFAQWFGSIHSFNFIKIKYKC